MTTAQMLTVKANAARSRLASLQRRAERLALPAGALVNAALKELADTLEQLQVASDELETQAAELGKARAAAVAAEQRFTDLLDVLPCPCVSTTAAGEILEANPSAARLLNVSRQHLAGRPLMLFLSGRSAFQSTLTALAGGSTVVADIQGEVRPRERRARLVRVVARRLTDDQICWFLLEGPGQQ